MMPAARLPALPVAPFRPPVNPRYAFVCLPLISGGKDRAEVNIYLVEAWVWVLLPGLTAVGVGVLAWFVMQSRMDVALARERERVATERGRLSKERGEIKAERGAMGSLVKAAVVASQEAARRKALEEFLDELRVEQRRFTRENAAARKRGKSLVLQERMYFKSIPLCGWIEHEAALEEGADVDRLANSLTVFERGVVNIASIARTPKPATGSREALPAIPKSLPKAATAPKRKPRPRAKPSTDLEGLAGWPAVTSPAGVPSGTQAKAAGAQN